MPGDQDEGQEAPPRLPTVLSGEVGSRADDTLEQRVRRLEEMMARLSRDDSATVDPSPLESQPPRAVPDPFRNAATTGPRPVPRATQIPPVPTASLAEFALPPPVPDASYRPLQRGLPLASHVLHRVLPPSSIVRDLWWDLRTGYRMLRDPSYPMTFAGKVVPLLAFFYVCIWPWFSAWTGLIGTLLSGLVNIVVLYVAYKVIQRELRRYYDFSQRYRR